MLWFDYYDKYSNKIKIIIYSCSGRVERGKLPTPLCPAGRQKITFCEIKSLKINGSSSNFEHFSLKIGHIFPANLKTIIKNKKWLY